MKKALLVLALAVALTMMLSAVAFADHSPSFFIQWDDNGGYGANPLQGGIGANAAVPSPHNGYVEGTQKCSVCHAVHRAPVAKTGWVALADNPDPTQPEGGLPFPAEAGGENRATRQTYTVPAGTDTQMLLQSDVAGACDYCHITTSIGGEQIYAGAVKYRLEATAGAGGSNWEGGFAHNNACTACHAVHGAFINPYAAAGATASANVVFQGAAAPKVLKAYAKNKSTTWMDEIYLAGTTADLTGLFGGVLPATSAKVATGNVPLFASQADAIAGTNARTGVDVADAQVTAFCTFCHENYGYGAEYTINAEFTDTTPALLEASWPTTAARGVEAYSDGKGLFQGPWVYNGYTVRNAIENVAVPGLDGHIPIKNHPMKAAATTGWYSKGKTTSAGQVAWANADTCRTCHDAGVEDFDGVMIQSWPHFTPGYFKFLKSGAYLGATMANIDVDLSSTPTVAAGDTAGLAAIQTVLDDPNVIEEVMCTSDGACLKCHVNGNNDMGVGKTF